MVPGKNIFNSAGNKLKKKIREFIINSVYRLNGKIIYKRAVAGDVRILIYHGVCNSDPFLLNSRFISAQLFEQHLITLKKYFNVISFEDYKNKNLSSEKLNVLLSFDDGFRNNYTVALPLLQKHNVPALFFITGTTNGWLFNDIADLLSLKGPNSITISGELFCRKKVFGHSRYFNRQGRSLQQLLQELGPGLRMQVTKEMQNQIGDSSLLEFDEYIDLMDENEISELSQTPGCAIGYHSRSHADLSRLNEEELGSELISDPAVFGVQPEALAFPYGNYNLKVLDKAQSKGFVYFFGTEKLNAPSDRQLVIERFTVNPYISAPCQMYYISAGKYD